MRNFEKVFMDACCDPQPVALERRRSNREQCELRGSILLGGTSIGICVVKDISIEGAKLVIPNTSWIPFEFGVSCLSDKISVRVQRVWASNGELGVRFLDPINLAVL